MITLLLATAPAAHALELGVGGYVGHLATPQDSPVDPSFAYGGRARLRWSDAWGVEASLGTADGALDPRLELLRFLGDPTGDVVPFVAVGGGAWLADEATWLADGGFGLDAALCPVADFRADARYRLLGTDDPTGAFFLNAGLQLHVPRARDADGDGIGDRDDTCRDVAEDVDAFEDADGCPDPDNDADGVADEADGCDAEAEDVDGFRDDDGCPDPDNDGDGVADAADGCDADAEDADGHQDGDGCPDPDNDGDGVADAKDAAPNEPETVNGYRDGDGAPDEVPAAVKKFSGRIEGIRFETGSAKIAASSTAVLDEAARVLVEFPDVRLEVQGHTDDVGDDAKNLALSQARAQSVADYLASRGVAAERLVAKGYGETQPEVPGTTKEARSQNRRVAFVLLP
ncbi:MAG: OmpA family protein [Myxococcota bacterium]